MIPLALRKETSMSVILVDRIGAVVFHNGVLRIDCIATGPNGEDRPAGTLLLPLNQAGAVLRSLIGAAQEVDRRLREQIRQAAAAQGAAQAAAQTASGQTASPQAAPAKAASTPATPEAMAAQGAHGGVEPAAVSGNGGSPRPPARSPSRNKKQPS
jgi:hypothetical protein